MAPKCCTLQQLVFRQGDGMRIKLAYLTWGILNLLNRKQSLMWLKPCWKPGYILQLADIHKTLIFLISNALMLQTVAFPILNLRTKLRRTEFPISLHPIPKQSTVLTSSFARKRGLSCHMIGSHRLWGLHA